MSAPSISVRGLRKAYRLYGHPRDMAIELLTGRPRHREFVALDDISFDVAPGSVVGLMGRNGAGKSTLLRVIAGTLDASAGTVTTTGRISAILELGTGFHLDYSGRENIYLGGLCLGLTRKEIDAQVDEVIAFSELSEHIDQPFRTYSSGMQARLAFSVATCVDPDILIIDEALAVGDARFQLKSFDRIRDFKRRGKSILVVSHSINQLTGICDRAILLDRGRMLMDGDVNAVGNAYHEMLFGPGAGVTSPQATVAEGTLSDGSAGREHRDGDGVARITAFRVRDAAGRTVTRLQSLERYAAEFDIQAFARTEELCAGVLVRNTRGQDVFGTDMLACECPLIPPLELGERVTARMNFRANLAAGTYFLTAALARADALKHDMRFDALMVEVEAVRGLYADTIVNLEPQFEFTSPTPMPAQAGARSG